MPTFKLTWQDDRGTTYRNAYTEDPRPTEITADTMNYLVAGDSVSGVQFWDDDDTEHTKYVFFELPSFIERL